MTRIAQTLRQCPARLALGIGAALTLAACGEEFLDRTPLNSYTFSNFWENEFQITQAVNALYPSIRGDYTGELWQLGEFRSDNTTYQINTADRGAIRTEEIDYFLSNSAMAPANGLWNGAYATISRANLILESIGEADFGGDEELRAQREAETRFVRAFMYWQLTRNFGDAILILEPEFEEAELLEFDRVPVAQIYDEAILPDLAVAIDNLPVAWPATETGRATRGAAQMLLAKAHFSRADFAAALPVLEAIVDEGEYALFPDYRGLFAPENENNEEIIFAGEFSVSAGQGANWMINWVPLNTGNELTGGGNAPAVGPRAGFNLPTRSLVEAYPAGDRRFGATIGLLTTSGGDSIYYNRKFLFTPLPSDVDFPIFRYGEVLLMLAEAQLEVTGDVPDEGIEAINLIRARAGLSFVFPGNPDSTLDVSTPAQFREVLQQERRLELALEHKRWYDLLRYDATGSLDLEAFMRAHGEEQREYQDFLDNFPEAYQDIPRLYPIPNQQVIQFGYEQNPGY